MSALLRTALTPHKFTVDDVRAMARAGVLDNVEKVELIDGVLIEMPADGPVILITASLWASGSFMR